VGAKTTTPTIRLRAARCDPGGKDERASQKIQTRARRVCLAKVDMWCAWFSRALRLDWSDAILEIAHFSDLEHHI
jgi:hypothetical protein